MVPPEWREQLRHISDSLPELWQSEQLSNVQRKQLLRCLISQVVLTKEAPDNVEVKIVWISGHYSTAYVHPSVFKQQDVTGYDEMVERIHSLWQRGLDDEQIAAKLVKEDFRSARSSAVSSMTVHRIRLAHEWYRPRHYGCHALELDGYLTTRGLAARLGVKRRWVYHRIRSGQIAPTYITRHPQSDIYLIQDDPELIAHLHQLLVLQRGFEAKG